MAYARGTKVSIVDTRMEIERTLERYGAESFSWHVEQRKAQLQFGIAKRFVRFKLPLPEPGSAKQERLRMEKWRSLLLVIKAKLESVHSGIETIDESFLAQIVTSDGTTVAETAVPALQEMYKTGKMQNFLAGPKL